MADAAATPDSRGPGSGLSRQTMLPDASDSCPDGQSQTPCHADPDRRSCSDVPYSKSPTLVMHARMHAAVRPHGLRVAPAASASVFACTRPDSCIRCPTRVYRARGQRPPRRQARAPRWQPPGAARGRARGRRGGARTLHCGVTLGRVATCGRPGYGSGQESVAQGDRGQVLRGAEGDKQFGGGR